ncbi:GerMN domain-containing protein [Myxococcota bacterium]|nr:GerMN domain-containing protein [Myxococcota bacterium]
MNFNSKLFVSIIIVAVAILIAIRSYQTETQFQQQLLMESNPQESLSVDLLPGSEKNQMTVSIFYPQPRPEIAGEIILIEGKYTVPDEGNVTRKALRIAQKSLEKSSPLIGPQSGITQLFILESGLAVVDLSRETSLQLTGSVSTELALLQAIARSITTNLEEVDRVRFLVGGREAPSLGGHISLAGPFR